MTYPDTRVVLLLVGLVGTLGVADLRVEVLDILGDVVTDTTEVGPLQIRVEVDLDDAVRDGVLELGRGRARPAVEDEEGRLVVLGVELLLQVSLVLAEPASKFVSNVKTPFREKLLPGRTYSSGWSLTLPGL